ncbi:MAG: histidinol-phosphate transaminase [Treponema sp.]|nr:histidinol-phosphate transaminase [Candidatus Treponema caballi]
MLAERLSHLNPYKPGEQPSDRDYIKLNANENPYPPPEAVTEEVSWLLTSSRKKLGLYPDPDSTKLREAIAKHLNQTGGVLASDSAAGELHFEITPDMVYCGNGSDEVLSFLYYAFFDNDAPLITPEFSYSFYPVYAGFYNIQLRKVPLKSDFSLDVEGMLKDAESSTGMLFANPNAPTGIALSRAEIRGMLERFPKDKVFVVDEAYADFGKESVLPLLSDFPNLVVVRTFSKSLSFAGMRMGYIVAAPELIRAVTTVKNSVNHFPADIICQTAAAAACSHTTYYRGTTVSIVTTREEFRDSLINAGWEVLPSQTNFVFARKAGKTGREVYEAVKAKGILIRHFDVPGISDFVRITIGTPEQMEMLLSAMEEI